MKDIFVIYISIVLLDYIWLKYFFGKYFLNMLENVQKEHVVIKPIRAFAAYIILVCIAYFSILKSNNVYEAFLFGFLIYAVYDSTNYATLNNYNLTLGIIDSLWGGVLFALTYLIYKKLNDF
jgi:uncharacterized membrane protein